MATITITKSSSGGNIGKEDLTLQSSTVTTFSRGTSSGGSNTLTRLARSTLNTREFDVVQYGAVGDGATDDTASIQAAIDAAEVAGGTVVFPPGYSFAVKPANINVAIFKLSSSYPMTFWMYGSEIVLKVTTDLDPNSAAKEKINATVFSAQGMDNLSFLGGVIDFNRDDATQDARHGFFKGTHCDNTVFRDITFKDGTNYWGAISMTDAVASTEARWHNLTIQGCTFQTSSMGIYLEGAMRNVNISGNSFHYMDLATRQSDADLYAIDDGYGAGTYKPCRAIKIQAFGNGDESATDDVNGGVLGVVDGISIANNTIYGCGLGIEIDTADITDAAYARNISVTGNTIFGLSGIKVEFCSNVVVKGNTFERLASTDLSAYDDIGYVNGLTAANYIANAGEGEGIDVRKSRDTVVADNVIDGAYLFSSQETTFTGIRMGENSDNISVNATVSGNTIRGCTTGIVPSQCSLSIIRDNKVSNSKVCLQTDWASSTTFNTGMSWKDNVLEGNYFLADPFEHSAAGNSLLLVDIEGSWTIKGNTFIGRTSTGADLRLLNLQGWDSDGSGASDIGDYSIKGNVFRRFQYTPVEIIGGADGEATAAVRVLLDGNEFYPETGSVAAITVGCVHINRPTSSQALTVVGGHNTCTDLRRAFTMDYPSLNGGTESYDFGDWQHDQNSDDTSTWALYEESTTNTGATGYAGTWRASRGIMVKQGQVRCNGGGSVQAIADFLPYGMILHVSVRNEETITMGSSGAGYYIGWGAGSTPTMDRYWGSVDALTNDVSNNAEVINHPTIPLLRGISSTENDIILSAKLASGALGGAFTDGDVLVTVYYIPVNASEF